MNDRSLSLVWATEQEFNNLVSGKLAGTPYPWPSYTRLRPDADSIGVIVRDRDAGAEHVHPIALVIPDRGQRRLFARFATLREDLSPLSTWTHIVSERHFGLLDHQEIRSALDGFETAWAGLVVAEAILLARRPLPQIKASACFATVTYAVGRAQAIWPRVEIEDVLERINMARGLVRSSQLHFDLAKELSPIWSCLSLAVHAMGRSPTGIERAIRGIADTRFSDGSTEASIVAQALQRWPEAALLHRLSDMHPEARVQAFDHLVDEIKGLENSSERREVLLFAAAYVASVAAGGAPSVSLAEGVANDLPAILGWAYVLIGLREKTNWTSAFNGLGRLVCRELTRSFHLDEPPQCDFAVEEGVNVIDQQLSDPLVHLKIKQQRAATVALLPGVYITLPLQEQNAAQAANRQSARSENRNDPARMADELWPYLLDRIKRELVGQKAGSPRKRAQSQTRFTLD